MIFLLTSSHLLKKYLTFCAVKIQKTVNENSGKRLGTRLLAATLHYLDSLLSKLNLFDKSWI